MVSICHRPDMWPCYIATKRNNICSWIISGDSVVPVEINKPNIGSCSSDQFLLLGPSWHAPRSQALILTMFLDKVESYNIFGLVKKLVSPCPVLRSERLRPDLNTLYRVFNEQTWGSALWGLRWKENLLDRETLLTKNKNISIFKNIYIFTICYLNICISIHDL